MKIHCPECDYQVEIADETLSGGVPKLRCGSCGAKFQVLSGGMTMTISQSGSTGPGNQSASGIAGGMMSPNLSMMGATEDSNQGAAPASGGGDVPLTEGDVVGHYEIRGKLGIGAFGSVFKALHQVTKEEVALKIVVPDPDRGSVSLDQLVNEHQVRGRISDVSHIVTTSSPGKLMVGDVEMISMEMPLGMMSLRDWLQRAPLEESEREAWQRQTLGFFQQACKGVAALHDAGLTHQDLKPENILLFSDGGETTAKITDFGLARLEGDKAGAQGVGTPKYMAPEQFDGRPKDLGPQTDVYELGIILFEILDGEPPFKAKDVTGYQNCHLQSPVPFQKWGEDRDALRKVLAKALAKDVESRQANGRAFLLELQKALAGATSILNVACPECGHVNRNCTLKVCEECGKSVTELFRSCPRCKAEVRRDQNTCPDCQFNVGAHFLLQDRWQRIIELENEDAEQCLSLLRLVLKDGAGEYEELAVTKLEQCRERDARVRKMITEAREAENKGEWGDALGIWSAVLSVLPRHREAQRKKDQICQRMMGLSKEVEKIEAFIRKAEFNKAHEVLNATMETHPGDADLNQLARRIHQTESSFSKHMPKLKQELQKKELRKVEKVLESLQEISPEAPVVKKTVKELNLKKTEVENALEEASELFKKADFAGAEAAVKRAESIQSDHPKVKKWKACSDKEKYLKKLDEAEVALGSKEWEKLREIAESLLSYCPKAKQPLDWKTLGDKKIKRSESLLEKLTESKRKADFATARAALQELADDMPTLLDYAHEKEDVLRLEEKVRKLEEEGEAHAKAHRLEKAQACFNQILEGGCGKAEQFIKRRDDLVKAFMQADSNLTEAWSEAVSENFIAAEAAFQKSLGADEARRKHVRQEIDRFRCEYEQQEKNKKVKERTSFVGKGIFFVVGLAVLGLTGLLAINWIRDTGWPWLAEDNWGNTLNLLIIWGIFVGVGSGVYNVKEKYGSIEDFGQLFIGNFIVHLLIVGAVGGLIWHFAGQSFQTGFNLSLVFDIIFFIIVSISFLAE